MATHSFKTTNIKGKEYVQVNERVLALRKLGEYKGYSIETEIYQLDAINCVIKAIVKDETGRIVATGFAHEDKDSSNINKTSYVENCETSAVGRALGFLGIGIETSIATAEEVEIAIAKQEQVVPKQQPVENPVAKPETKTKALPTIPKDKFIAGCNYISEAAIGGKDVEAAMKKVLGKWANEYQEPTKQQYEVIDAAAKGVELDDLMKLIETLKTI
jgi:hypothetical protein